MRIVGRSFACLGCRRHGGSKGAAGVADVNAVVSHQAALRVGAHGLHILLVGEFLHEPFSGS